MGSMTRRDRPSCTESARELCRGDVCECVLPRRGTRARRWAVWPRCALMKLCGCFFVLFCFAFLCERIPICASLALSLVIALCVCTYLINWRAGIDAILAYDI